MGITSVRMPDELAERLERTAENLRRSKGWVIKEAVAQYLAREEQRQHRDQETLASWDAYKAGRVVDGDKVLAWLETWGDKNEQAPPTK